MADGVRVRVATQYDEAAVLDLVRADGTATGRQPGRTQLAALRTDLRSANALTLVADTGTEVVGVLVARIGHARSAQLELVLLCVRPDRRRAGTGRALVAGLLNRFGAVSAEVVDPSVTGLLRACGFRRGETSEDEAERWAHP